MKQKAQFIQAIVKILFAYLAFVLLRKAGEGFFEAAWGKGNWLGGFSPKLGLVFFVFVLLASLVYLGLVVRLFWPSLISGYELRLIKYRNQLGWLRWVAVAVVLFLPMWLIQYKYLGVIYTDKDIRYLIFVVMATSVGVLTTTREENLVNISALIVGSLLTAGIFILGEAFQQVTDYPFSLSWSEGNRIWDYSVLFGRRLYNYPTDQPIYAFIDLGRQSLWGLPFLLSGVSIQHVRLWHGIVITAPYAALGWVAFLRTRQNTGLWLLSGVWALVFLSQGPIYTPLVLSAILVVIAWRSHPWIGFFLIILAGYYAQLTRFTWIFAPAIWAGMIFVGDLSLGSTGLRNWSWKRIVSNVFAGVLGGYLIPRLPAIAQSITAVINPQFQPATPPAPGNDVISPGGILSAVSYQPLLWERLLPNPTFELGILAALALATLPSTLFLIYLIVSRSWSLDWLRGVAILGALLLFLTIGLIVSVKIGGGGDLHNLDMYLISLLLTAALAWKAGADRVLARLDLEPIWLQLLLLAMMVIFAYRPLIEARPLTLPREEIVKSALKFISGEVADAQEKGDVLFLDQRQLLTFGYVQDVPLIVDYEKKYVMDKAMASDAEYFAQFYEDLANSRFSLIISEPLHRKFRGSEYHFGNENDAWVRWVSRPVLCYYRPIETYRELRAQLLVPREGSRDCP